MHIDACRAEDLERPEEPIPYGPSRFHEPRLARQEQGTSTYLIAWIDEVPVGHAEFWWNGCAAAEVTQRFPGCAEINALDAWPDRWSYLWSARPC